VTAAASFSAPGPDVGCNGFENVQPQRSDEDGMWVPAFMRLSCDDDGRRRKKTPIRRKPSATALVYRCSGSTATLIGLDGRCCAAESVASILTTVGEVVMKHHNHAVLSRRLSFQTLQPFPVQPFPVPSQLARAAHDTTPFRNITVRIWARKSLPVSKEGPPLS